MAITTMIGAKIHRREDPRLISGEGHYVDDFTRPGTVFLAVVRSPYAHARIKSIDITEATKAPGVVGVCGPPHAASSVTATVPQAPAKNIRLDNIPEAAMRDPLSSMRTPRRIVGTPCPVANRCAAVKPRVQPRHRAAGL